MRLILVRHGESYNNAANRIDTLAPGAVLTETGWTQANDVVVPLLAFEPRAIWASNLTRARQTATPLATRLGLDVQIHEGFREIEAGSFEGGTTAADYRNYSETIVRWVRGSKDEPIGGDPAITGATVAARFDDAVRAVEDTLGGSSGVASSHAACTPTAVVFAHAAAISYWVGIRGGVEIRREDFVPLRNTGIVVLAGSLDAGYRLQSWMHLTF